ncbi:MAG: hypothetical protein LBO00_02885 [Zoogloeaceae bacterium]|nr:hypothetical protein [Zoogloeaceae bacterium]
MREALFPSLPTLVGAALMETSSTREKPPWSPARFMDWGARGGRNASAGRDADAS